MAVLLAGAMIGSIAPGMAANAASTGDGCSLSVMVTWNEEGDETAKTGLDLLDQLQEKYPDLDLKVETVAHDLYEDKLKTLMATDSLPDIFQALPGVMPSMYANDQISDLSDDIAADEEWSGRMLDGAFVDFTFGDQILAVPQSQIICSMIFYNAAIFEECGISEFPKTVEDLETAVTALKDNGYIPLACGNKAGYMISSQQAVGLIWRYVDEEWYNSLKNGGDAKFTDDCMLQAVTEMQKLMELGLYNEDVNSLDENTANGYYYNGEAAMMAGGFWCASGIEANGTEDVVANTKVALWPSADDAEKADAVPGGQGWGVSLSAATEGENREIAIEFLKSLSDPDIQARIAASGSIPCAETSEYDASERGPIIKAMYEVIDNCRIVPNAEIQLNATYVSEAEDAWQELSIGSITPEELLERLQEAYESGQE